MSGVRQKGEGGLMQRHDHKSCPPLVDGERAAHRCQGRWVGTIDTIEGGRRRRKYVYARTQRAARIKLAEAVRARDAGTLVVASVTVEQWLDTWLPRAKLKPQTRRGYASKIRTYLKPHLGRHRLTALHPTHIDAMYDAMREQGLAEATLRQTHAILKKSLNDAVKKGLLAANPVNRADAPAVSKNPRRGLTIEQSRKVLRTADTARWWLALFYGMRQGECLGLRWECVDFDRRTLTIERTLQQDDDGGWIFDTPKSDTSARTLPLHPLLEARLRLRWIEQGQPAEGLVFAREDGSNVRPWDDWQEWSDLLVEAGVPHVALHAARNSAASLMEAAGILDRLVMQILGQSSVQVTHGYQHTEVERMRPAFDAAGELLAGPG